MIKRISYQKVIKLDLMSTYMTDVNANAQAMFDDMQHTCYTSSDHFLANYYQGLLNDYYREENWTFYYISHCWL